jgi:hypothetical protein
MIMAARVFYERGPTEIVVVPLTLARRPTSLEFSNGR